MSIRPPQKTDNSKGIDRKGLTMNYDDWKLMTPEEDNGTAYDEYVPVEVEVEIYDLGQNDLDAFKSENSQVHFEDGCTTFSTTITVDVPLICDRYERECYVEEDDVTDAVFNMLGKDCEYEILSWERK